MNSTSRRRGILAALASLVGLVFAKESRADAADDVVRKHMRKGNPPTQPLDTMILFERGDDNNGEAITHEVLSLIHQEKGKNSYPWTLYTSLDTHHEVGDACVHCARLHKNGPGWSAGVHSEVFNHARAVALGVNIEMSNDFRGADWTKVIGLNIQAVGGPTAMQYAIHVHDKDESAHFDCAVGLNGRGKVGIDLAGKYGVGINLHGNSIRVSEGTCVEFDEGGRVRMRYRGGRIEFLNGERCVAFLDMNAGTERGL